MMLRASQSLWRGVSGRVCGGVGGYRTTQLHNRYKTTSSNVQEDISGTADVVVIGGGALGCSCLYHLTKLGVTNAVLLEAHKLTAGTTWHTAGLLYRLARSEVDFLLQDTTRQLLLSLQEETGVDPGLRVNGSIFFTAQDEHSDARRAEFERFVNFGRVIGVECYMVDGGEVKALHPLLDTTHFAAGVYSPTDGSMDPSGLCEGLSRAAVRAGARVVEGCPVTGITTEESLLGGRRVTHVHTNRGTINTNAVINAAGGWANDISGMVGVQLPLQVYKHGYVVSGTIPGAEKVPNVRNYTASCYYKSQGDSLIVGGFEPDPVPIEKLGPDTPFDLYELDWDVFSGLLTGSAKYLPALDEVGIKSTVYGPESFTPDHKALVGEDANVSGLYHCCGFNSHGMQLSGGCGQQLAHWVVEGRPTLDMFSYNVRRFQPRLVKDQTWVLSRSHEGLTKNYSLVFPHDEPLAGRGMRLSPLHQELEDRGAVFQERHGWERPGWFQSEPAPLQPYDWYGAYGTLLAPDQRYLEALSVDYTFDHPRHLSTLEKECLTCRQKAALFDLTSFGKFLLTGPDADAVAAWVFSAPASTREPGSTVYTCMLNHRGGVEADLTASVCESGKGLDCEPAYEGRGYYIATGGSTAEYCRAHIVCEARRKGWQINMTDLSEDITILSLQGPLSRTILQQITDYSLVDASFPFASHRVITVAGHKARAVRLSFVGELGWELHVPRDSAVAVYQAIKKAGQRLGLVDAGFRAMDSLSCEKGYRHWHADLRPDDTPLEAGMAFTCKLKTDTDFLGRSALEKQLDQGLTRRLVTLTLQGPSPPPLWGHEGIKRDGQVVGLVRRAEHAFTLDTILAYGYIQRPDGKHVTKEFLNTGTWEIEARLKTLPANLHFTHPFDPKNLRIKGIYDQDTNG